ncbi:MAG: hypothetical protein JWQ18_2244 [Conexibacter sp.]|nr:hypothetical protein [Conexibacter sp.]
MGRALDRTDEEPPDPLGFPPDRIAIWPIEDGTFGVDAIFQGPDAHRQAGFHEAILKLRDIPCSLRQEPDRSWTLRLGPLPRPLVEQAIALFIGSTR